MKQIFLKFADKKTADAAIKPYIAPQDEGMFAAIYGFAVDIVGDIYEMDGETATKLPGYHVNMLAPDDFTALAKYEIFPKTPSRIFAGWDV